MITSQRRRGTESPALWMASWGRFSRRYDNIGKRGLMNRNGPCLKKVVKGSQRNACEAATHRLFEVVHCDGYNIKTTCLSLNKTVIDVCNARDWLWCYWFWITIIVTFELCEAIVIIENKWSWLPTEEYQNLYRTLYFPYDRFLKVAECLFLLFIVIIYIFSKIWSIWLCTKQITYNIA